MRRVNSSLRQYPKISFQTVEGLDLDRGKQRNQAACNKCKKNVYTCIKFSLNPFGRDLQFYTI